MDSEVDPANVAVADGNLTLTLTGTYDITCSAVGINADPPVHSPESATSSASNARDPVSFDNGVNSNVFIAGVSQPYGSGATNPKIDVTFENRNGQSKRVFSARFLTYYDAATGQNKPVPARLKVANSTPWLNESDPRRSLDSPVSIPAGR